jgi:hypothetical protein
MVRTTGGTSCYARHVVQYDGAGMGAQSSQTANGSLRASVSSAAAAGLPIV